MLCRLIEFNESLFYTFLLASETLSGVYKFELVRYKPEGQGSYNSTINRVHGL